MPIHRSRRILALCAAALGAYCNPSHAATRSWSNTAGGSFNTAGNWSPAGAVPGPADTALFDLNVAPYTITFAANVVNDRLIVGRDNVTFSLAGRQYDIANTSSISRGIIVGEFPTDHATLRLLNGTLNAIYSTIARDDGSTGSVTVGAGGRWATSGLIVGDSGDATLRVESGGILSTGEAVIGANSTGSGIVTVTGTGSVWTSVNNIHIGSLSLSTGVGTLNVQSAGTVTSTMATFVRSGSTLNISGLNSRFRANTFLNVGSAGSTAIMNISDDGRATAPEIFVGGTANILTEGQLSTGHLVVSNGQCTVASTAAVSVDHLLPTIISPFHFGIGVDGVGVVDVNGNGHINNTGELFIGQDVGSEGTLNITDPGSSFTNSGQVTVGNSGRGTVNILNGGSLSATDLFMGGIAAFITVDGAGSNLRTGRMFMAGGATLPGTGTASLTVRNSGAVNITSTPFLVHQNGTINLQGGTITARQLELRGGLVNHTGGSMQLTASGSLAPSAHGIFVGITGPGTLNVNSGGRLNTTGTASLAHGAGSTASATINGPGSRWTHVGEQNIGVVGNAALTVTNSAIASTTGTVFIGRAATSDSSADVLGMGSRWDITEDLYVGAFGSGQANVVNGGILTNRHAFLAANPGSSSYVTIAGSGATWNNSGALFIGGNASAPGGDAVLEAGGPGMDGFVNVRDFIKVWPAGRIAMERGDVITPQLDIVGGRVNQGLLAPLFISDAGAPSFFGYGVYIGMAGGTGTVNVSAGGDLFGDNEFYIGGDAGSTGIATLDGAGSTWTANNFLALGYHGTGTLSITNGGAMTGGGTAGFSAILGYFADGDGTLTVDGPGSVLDHSRDMDVASAGKGAMTILNGGDVISAIARVGALVGSNGSVKIVGGNARWLSSGLFIGGSETGAGGVGLVHVEDTGILEVVSETTLWPSGTLNMYGGFVTTSELRLRGGTFSAYDNFNPNISNGGGTIDVPASRTLWLNGNLVSAASAVLTKKGKGALVITGAQSHGAGAVLDVAEGDVAINTNAGVAATAAFPAIANLTIVIASDQAGVFLNTNQELHNLVIDPTIAGRQSFNLNSPLTPGAFRAVRIYDGGKAALWADIVHANRAGAPDASDGIFDSGRSAHPNSGIGLAKVSDAHGDANLLIRLTRIGDLNLDGTVSIADFLALSGNFGQAGPNITWQEGDVNYDNQVSIADFLALSSNFGSSYSGDFRAISESESATLSSFASTRGVSSVPEPSAIALALSFSPLLLRRRRLH
jgi:T5SS/PEP-CTERM-associated repeat protein